jgi:response regulator RpfG family c-di-GMP phosphodiesterase
MTDSGHSSISTELSTDKPLYILCVDDEENILVALKRLFRAEPYQVLTATSGKEGLEILRNNESIGLILSDQRMPEMSGTLFLQAARELVPDVYRIILTAFADADAAIDSINRGGAHRFLVKPWNKQELLLTVREGLQRFLLIRENLRLKEEVAQWNTNLKKRVMQQTALVRKKQEETRLQDVRTSSISATVSLVFSDLQEQRNQRIWKHSRSVAALVEAMATALTLPQAQREEFRKAALLHDIGLLGVSDRILAKSEEMMGSDELAEHRAHAVKGEALMARNGELRGIGLIIRHHHEEFDGSGFPDGLAGEEIPLGARLIHLASFMDNAYLPELGMDAKFQLTRKLAAGMGNRFDPALAAAANLALLEVLNAPPRQRLVVELELLIKDMKVGMVVTRDFYDNHGILLVKQGTRITPGSLETFRQYHQSILMNRTMHVERSSAGDDNG